MFFNSSLGGIQHYLDCKQAAFGLPSVVVLKFVFQFLPRFLCCCVHSTWGNKTAFGKIPGGCHRVCCFHANHLMTRSESIKKKLKGLRFFFFNLMLLIYETFARLCLPWILMAFMFTLLTFNYVSTVVPWVIRYKIENFATKISMGKVQLIVFLLYETIILNTTVILCK